MHSLSDRDLQTMTAHCSECNARVAIRKAGNGYQCALKKAQGHKEWAKKNPEKAAANRRPGIPHQIIQQDRSDDTGYCVVCRKRVSLVPYGRGMICQNRFVPDFDYNRRHGPTGAGEDFGWSGFHLTGPWENPYDMPEYESAVPGWKTIGARE